MPGFPCQKSVLGLLACFSLGFPILALAGPPGDSASRVRNSGPSAARSIDCPGPLPVTGGDRETAIRALLFKARFFRDFPGHKAEGEKVLKEAGRMVERAITLSPHDATLNALLGERDLLMIQYKGFPAGMSYATGAGKANDRALSLDPNNPEAHLSRGIELYFKPWFVGGSVKGALREFKTADILRPHDARILSWVGIALHRLGRPGDRTYEEAAVRLCPSSSLYRSRGKSFNPRASHS